MAVIEAKGLSYRFDSRSEWSVKDVDLDVREGEVVGILGSSGCGKSTLAYILCGLIPGQTQKGTLQGSLVVRGSDMLATGRSRVSLEVGIVLQNPDSQLFGFSVEDTIAFGLENRCVKRTELCRRVDTIIRDLNIEHLRKCFTGELSGGQKQVVCIASVLAMDPAVIIMDEPVSSLDPGGRLLIEKTLARLKELGKTILVIDHNIEWVAPILDRVVVLEKGEKVFDGSVNMFLGDSNMLCRSGVTPPQVTEVYHCLRNAGYEIPVLSGYPQALDVLTRFGLISRRDVNYGNDESSCEGDISSISTHQLSHAYDKHVALEGVNLEIPRGKVTAVVGQNGSGKTTLVKHFNGLLKPTSGDLSVEGVRPSEKSVAEMARKVGFVFQNPDQMLFEATVEQEALFAVKATQGCVTADDINRVNGLLKRFGLGEYSSMAPFDLAAGEKQSLAIVSALSLEPDVLVLDEPTLGFDANRKAELKALIREFRKEGRTVVLISHDLSLVADVSDNVILMNHGRVKAQGPVSEVFPLKDAFDELGIPLPQVTRLGMQAGCTGVLNVSQLMALFFGNESNNRYREALACE